MKDNEQNLGRTEGQIFDFDPQEPEIKEFKGTTTLIGAGVVLGGGAIGMYALSFAGSKIVEALTGIPVHTFLESRTMGSAEGAAFYAPVLFVTAIGGLYAGMDLTIRGGKRLGFFRYVS